MHAGSLEGMGLNGSPRGRLHIGGWNGEALYAPVPHVKKRAPAKLGPRPPRARAPKDEACTALDAWNDESARSTTPSERDVIALLVARRSMSTARAFAAEGVVWSVVGR